MTNQMVPFPTTLSDLFTLNVNQLFQVFANKVNEIFFEQLCSS